MGSYSISSEHDSSKFSFPGGEAYLGDAFNLIQGFGSSTVDLVLTDPPYFLDKLDNSWDSRKVKVTTSGMRFDPEQGKRLYEWYLHISRELFRVAKPGAFFFSFSSPRLLHRMAIAIEDAGFYIRDVFIWLYKNGRAKAFSLDRFTSSEEEKRLLSGWKTPQVRANYEAIVVAQKPPQGTLVNNFLKFGVGLFNFSEKLEGGYTPSNVLQTDEIEGVPSIFLVPKPGKQEKGWYNDHPTVKPIELLRLLIRLSTREGALVLDPFAGTGSVALASLSEKRRFVGFEIDRHYFEILVKRVTSLLEGEL